MSESLMSQGASLMLFGMGTVFVFLAVLVVVTYLMSKVVVRFFPEPPEPAPAVRVPVAVPATGGAVDQGTLKVIQAAIDRHRAK